MNTSEISALLGATPSSIEDSMESDVTVKKTIFGDVKGVDTGSTVVYYGIPYAASPIGELRWQAPVNPERWTQTLDCTEPKDMALQFVTDSETGENTSTGTEDCLNLDVYTTKDAKDLPVLVYIHGGNNQTGSAQEIEGNGIVVKDECVFVALTYRLGLLGFNCLPALLDDDNPTGNFTLLDIAKGLDWIKENIAAFGGDPNNITVSGFSAGGRDVMAMLISPLFEGKFDKAIVFSGGMTTSDVKRSTSTIASYIAPLAVDDGKAAAEKDAKAWLQEEKEEVKDYLYSISSERLAALVCNASIRMAAFPHLYEDDVVLPAEGFDTTNYNHVPLLMLTGSTEFSFFNNFIPYFSSGEYTTTFTEEEQAAGIAFGNRYGSDMYRIFNTQMSAEKMYDQYKAPMYLCQIDYGCDTSKSVIPAFGAFHGIFVPMIAGTKGYTGLYDFTQNGYQAMSDAFNKYLANFLKKGDPNGGDLPKWEAWTSETKLTQVFDADETDGSAIVEPKNVFKTYDEIMAEMDADTTCSDALKAVVIKNSMNGRWFSDAVDAKYGNESLWKE